MSGVDKAAIKAALASRDSARQQQFEHTWSVSLAVKLGIPRSQVSNDGFSFARLARLVSLPVRLFAENVPYTHEVSLSSLFRFGDFCQTPVWKAYTSGIEQRDIPADDFAGLITRWTGLPVMVLHDWPHHYESSDRAEGISFVRWHTSKFGRTQIFTLESLDSFAAALRYSNYRVM